MKYYVDTCIWIDYWENRQDDLKPLGEFAFQFFQKVIKEKHTVYFSNIVIKELERRYDNNIIEEIFAILKENIKYIEYSKKDVNSAFMLSKKRNIPFGDALHIILASRYECILVSRDKHFIEAYAPEELL